jgi:AhpD family alkylhydroperoxidase
MYKMVIESQQFMKRMYSPKAFYRLLVDMLKNLKDMREAGRSKRISHEFSERIMMAVTEVNGCRYCSYFHAQMALKAGIGKDEIDRTLLGDFNFAPQEEVAALYFAQYYAESGGNPNQESIQCLVENYGNLLTKDILVYIRTIMIGNAWGNMFDALWMRIKGKPNKETTFLKEFGVVFGSLLMVPAIFIQLVLNKLSGKTKPAIHNL